MHWILFEYCPYTSLISIELTTVHALVCRWNNLGFQDVHLGEVCWACDTNYSFILSMVGRGDKTKSILNYVMLVCCSAYFVRNSSLYFHLRNGCVEQNCSERRAFLYEYDVFLFKKYVRWKGICWRLISLPFPLKTMWTPKSSSPLLTPLKHIYNEWFLNIF